MPVSRRRFTVDEYERMAEAGILGEDDPVELLEGEVVEMAPVGPRHAGCVKRLNRLLSSRLGDRAVISVQTRSGSGFALSRSPTWHCSSPAPISTPPAIQNLTTSCW